MTTVSIYIDPENVDDVRLTIQGDVPHIIKLKNRVSACDLNHAASLLYYQVHSDNNIEHTINIDGKPYTFSLKVWFSIMKALDEEWISNYFHAECPDETPEESSRFVFRRKIFKALEYLEKANRLYDQGERETAIEAYAEAIILDPQLVLAYKNLGLVAGELSRFDLALDYFNKVIEMEGDEAVNYRNRGAIYYYLSLFDAALSDFNKAINIDDSYADAYYWRGLVNLKSFPQQSLEDFGTAIELSSDNDNDQYYLDRACAHSMMEDFKAAKIDAASAIKINPGNPIVHEHLKIFNELLEGNVDGIEVKKNLKYFF